MGVRLANAQKRDVFYIVVQIISGIVFNCHESTGWTISFVDMIFLVPSVNDHMQTRLMVSLLVISTVFPTLAIPFLYMLFYTWYFTRYLGFMKLLNENGAECVAP